MYSIIIRMVYTENAVVDFGRLGLRQSRKRNRQRIGTTKGGSRANLKEGQLVVGLKNFQKFVTRVCCKQQFQIHFRSKQYNFEVILEAN